MINCCIIITTTDKIEVSNIISHHLIKQRYVKCIQRDNIESIYEWNGEIVTSIEYRLMIKSTASKYDLVVAYIKEVHNYDVPEIIKINIDDGSEEYIKWMTD
jgi:periplasmic divalent cation tolerance protein